MIKVVVVGRLPRWIGLTDLTAEDTGKISAEIAEPLDEIFADFSACLPFAFSAVSAFQRTIQAYIHAARLVLRKQIGLTA